MGGVLSISPSMKSEKPWDVAQRCHNSAHGSTIVHSIWPKLRNPCFDFNIMQFSSAFNEKLKSRAFAVNTHTQKCRQEFNQKNQSAQPMNLIRQPPFTVARVLFTNNGPHGVVMSTFSSRALLMLDRDVASGNGASFSSDNSSARAAWLTNFFLPKSASMAESRAENGIR